MNQCNDKSPNFYKSRNQLVDPITRQNYSLATAQKRSVQLKTPVRVQWGPKRLLVLGTR